MTEQSDSQPAGHRLARYLALITVVSASLPRMDADARASVAESGRLR